MMVRKNAERAETSDPEIGSLGSGLNILEQLIGYCLSGGSLASSSLAVYHITV